MGWHTSSSLGDKWSLSPSPTPLSLQELGPLPHEDSNLMLHLQRLETTLSVCAEEPDHNQLFTHLGRMALEFNRLASKVHKNEQRTSILQVGQALRLCQSHFLPVPQLFSGPRATMGTSKGCVADRLWGSNQSGQEGKEVVGKDGGRGRKWGNTG